MGFTSGLVQFSFVNSRNQFQVPCYKRIARMWGWALAVRPEDKSLLYLWKGFPWRAAAMRAVGLLCQVSEVRLSQRKFIDWKKTKLFLLSLELGRRDKVARHPSAMFLPPLYPQPVPPPHLFMTGNNAPSVRRKGWSGFCRYYSCCENALERD